VGGAARLQLPDTLKRLLRARVTHPPLLMANAIYASRIARRADLIPVGEEIPADLAAV
jgi:hypothetical protein